MKIVILGNGFDIYHGLKTSFSDFRTYLLEMTDDQIVNDIDEVIKRNDTSYTNENISYAWNDFERILGMEFSRSRTVQSQIDKLEDLLEDFVEKFYEYLGKINALDIDLNENIQNELIDSDIILCLNYTNTYSKYDLKDTSDVFHIHGSLHDELFPIIGFYVDNAKKHKHVDYSARYSGNIHHKPALAYKQNSLDLDKLITDFNTKYTNKVTEVVSIGYSYGSSDIHIFDILNKVMVAQSTDKNVRTDILDKLKLIHYKIFNYDTDETIGIQAKIISTLNKRYNRKTSVRVFGNSIKKETAELIRFRYLDY